MVNFFFVFFGTAMPSKSELRLRGAFIVVVKKRSGIETFFSTTVHSFMLPFRISENYYGKQYNCDSSYADNHWMSRARLSNEGLKI
jgi:hypothetical protein